MSDADIIPVIDLAPYLAGDPGALDRAAGELRFALTEIGFYFIVNHGVMPELVHDAFRQAARFHAQPLAAKLAIRIDKHNVGYLPMRGDTLRTSTVETVTKPNLNEALFVARDLPPDHPEVIAGRRFRSANQWPAGLPGFRKTVIAYCDAMERLVQKLVRLYARAVDLPAAYFDQPFAEPQYKLRMTHYPSEPDAPADEFGIAPHTDTSFLTLLAPNEVPGLSIRTQSGRWIDAPAIPDAFVVNGGQLLQRFKAGYSGVLPSLLSEQFPVETRGIGVSLSFSTAVTIFGGFAPFVATWLIARTGNPLSPSYYLIVTALLSLGALTVICWRTRPAARTLALTG